MPLWITLRFNALGVRHWTNICGDAPARIAVAGASTYFPFEHGSAILKVPRSERGIAGAGGFADLTPLLDFGLKDTLDHSTIKVAAAGSGNVATSPKRVNRVTGTV
jgi:hypothetical protein